MALKVLEIPNPHLWHLEKIQKYFCQKKSQRFFNSLLSTGKSCRKIQFFGKFLLTIKILCPESVLKKLLKNSFFFLLRSLRISFLHNPHDPCADIHILQTRSQEKFLENTRLTLDVLKILLNFKFIYLRKFSEIFP